MKYTNKQYASSLISALHGKAVKEQGQAIKRFLGILAKNGDAQKRNQILSEVKREYFKKNDIHKVDVQSAVKLSDSLKKDLEEALGKKIILDENIKPELIGGIKILIDDETLIDATIKTQLDKMFNRSETTNLF